MKKLLQTNINDGALQIGILILRLSSGAFMLTHGYGKMQKLMAGGDIQWADPLGIGPAASLALAVFAEVFCAVFIILGLGTRLAAIPLIVTMLVAAFIAHGGDPFGKKEMALLYLVMYVLVLIVGGGKYSLDNVLFKKK